MTLALLALLAAQDVEDIASRAGDVDPDTRAAAAKEAAEYVLVHESPKTPAGRALLTLAGKHDASKLLKENDAVARRVACEKLFVKAEHADELMKMLESDETETRIAAIRAIAKVADPNLRQTFTTAIVTRMQKKRTNDWQILYYFAYSLWYNYPVQIESFLGADRTTTELAIAALAHLPRPKGSSNAAYGSVLRDDKIGLKYRELLLKTITRTNPTDAIGLLTLNDPALRARIVEALDQALDDPMQAKALFSVLPQAGPLTDGRSPSKPIREWIAAWIRRLCGEEVTLEKFESWWQTNRRALLDKQVNASIRKGAAALRKLQEKNGTWTYSSSYPVGVTAMAVYTLIKCGIELEDEAVEKGLEVLLERDPEGTYSAALVAMALSQAVEKQKERKETVDGKIARRLQLVADMLSASQTRTGGWSYTIVRKPGTTDKPMDGGYDLSNTQFAVLGLRAALNGGAKVHKGIWERALALFEKQQGSDGGWGYSGAGSSYTMSAAGAMGWLICKLSLESSSKPDTLLKNSRMEKSLQYFDGIVSGGIQTGYGFYWLYSLERFCMTAGIEMISRRDWYEEGATWLVAQQRTDGLWMNQYGTGVDTCFALLFLTRAYITRPDVETPRRVAPAKAADVFRKHQEAIRAVAGVVDVIVDETSEGAYLLIIVSTSAAEKDLKKRYGDSIDGVPVRIQLKP